MSKPTIGLFQKPVNGIVEVLDDLIVALPDGFNDALADVVFQDEVAGVVNSGSNGGELDQDLATVGIAFHHAFDGFNVTGSF